MNFAVLNQLAQDNLAGIVIVLAVLLIVFVVLSFVMMSKLNKAQKRYQELLNGDTGKSLEASIADNVAKLNELIAKNEQLDCDYKDMRSLFESSVQKVAVQRFCAFKDMGGDLSYAVAMLDYHNTGVVFSSIFGRQESCTYVKPIIEGKSEYPLSDEEKKVLAEAIAK